jgi:hypothetical protein
VQTGDLVRVGIPTSGARSFVAIVTAVRLPEAHMNRMHLVQVLENGGRIWYPVGYIEVINANR